METARQRVLKVTSADLRRKAKTPVISGFDKAKGHRQPKPQFAC
jgi:hypothetical protein